MAATSQILIDCKSMLKDCYTILVINLANAVRDHEHGNFLSERIDSILSEIMGFYPDIVVFLEWGRWPVDKNGFKLTPGVIIDRMDEELELSFFGANRSNASSMALGKAVFYRQSTIWIDSMTTESVSTVGWGSDILTLQVAPVQSGKIRSSDDKILTTAISIAHAPVGPVPRRDFYSKLIQKLNQTPDESSPILIGDFNTFGDCPFASEFLTEMNLGYKDMMPEDNTFCGYPYDILKIPIETYDSTVHVGTKVETEETHVSIIPESLLDHAFVSHTFPDQVEVELHSWKKLGKNKLSPSDHKIIEVTVNY